jgi:hypothetical protein
MDACPGNIRELMLLLDIVQELVVTHLVRMRTRKELIFETSDDQSLEPMVL